MYFQDCFQRLKAFCILIEYNLAFKFKTLRCSCCSHSFINSHPIWNRFIWSCIKNTVYQFWKWLRLLNLVEFWYLSLEVQCGICKGLSSFAWAFSFSRSYYTVWCFNGTAILISSYKCPKQFKIQIPNEFEEEHNLHSSSRAKGLLCKLALPSLLRGNVREPVPRTWQSQYSSRFPCA